MNTFATGTGEQLAAGLNPLCPAAPFGHRVNNGGGNAPHLACIAAGHSLSHIVAHGES